MITELLAYFDKEGLFLAGITRDENGVPTEFKKGDLAFQLGELTEAALLRVKEVHREKEALIIQNDADISAVTAKNKTDLDVANTATERANVELAAYKEQGIKAAQDVIAIVDDLSIDPEQTAIRCKYIALQIVANETERQKLSLIKKRQEIDAELAKLEAP